jgi:hypothetical protein
MVVHDAEIVAFERVFDENPFLLTILSFFPRSFQSAHTFLPPTQWRRSHEATAAVGTLLALLPGQTK